MPLNGSTSLPFARVALFAKTFLAVGERVTPHINMAKIHHLLSTHPFSHFFTTHHHPSLPCSRKKHAPQSTLPSMSNSNQRSLRQNQGNTNSSHSAAVPQQVDHSLDHPYPAHQYPFQHQQEHQEYHASTVAQAVTAPQEAPPSYEAIVTKDLSDISQIHDNYDHLRGPPGQRGQDIKIRIPAESLPSSSAYYQASGSSSSGSGSGSGSGGNNGAGPSSVPHSNDTRAYGAISSGQAAGRTGIVHSPTSAQASGMGLRGQIALTPDDEEAELALDVDRLLGADNDSTDLRSEDSDQDTSSWAIAGDPQVWWSLCYLLVILMPWTLFCFVWTFCMAMMSTLLMIIPPLGYLWTVFSVTSWRALARVDLVLSRSMVSSEVQQRYPFIPAQICIAPEPGPTYRAFGQSFTLPCGGCCIARRSGSRRDRRVKNLWHRSARHMRAILDRHSIRGMFYFTVWKMMFALPVWCIMWLFFGLTIPFMICFLPSLLVVSRTFANWHYRWSVKWLSEKSAPIVL